MITRHYKSVTIKDNPHNLDVRQLYDHESAQVMHITLMPGESLKPHKTPVDVVFFVLEGSPVVHIGNESEEFPEGTLIESPAEIVHYISNPGKQLARILVIKAPRPDKPARFI